MKYIKSFRLFEAENYPEPAQTQDSSEGDKMKVLLKDAFEHFEEKNAPIDLDVFLHDTKWSSLYRWQRVFFYEGKPVQNVQTSIKKKIDYFITKYWEQPVEVDIKDDGTIGIHLEDLVLSAKSSDIGSFKKALENVAKTEKNVG